MAAMDPLIHITQLDKSFCLHTQGRVSLPVLQRFEFRLCRCESVALMGPSGIGKSTLLRLIYGNY